ncbi:MAG: hypothetical protein HN348_32750, partial [Proteobacteria bacterium]|nr:hypothetical protein [Pseudomonadota bacterium]
MADLRLWKDGNWLVDAKPSCQPLGASAAQPQQQCVLSTTLESGLYLLTAYGGKSEPWAEESDVKPFFLRWGVEKLASTSRQRFEVGPIGVDHWLVSDADYFRLELPANEPASLMVSSWHSSNPYSVSGRKVHITDESRYPIAEISSTASGTNLVTIVATPGQPYVLQHFDSIGEKTSLARDRNGGDYFVGTLHSGVASDSAAPTAMVTDSSHRTLALQTLTMDLKHIYQRRFNLIDTVELFVFIDQKGSYEFAATETETELRLEPFLLTYPPHYISPEFSSEPLHEDLNAGLYRLSIKPKTPGVVDLSIKPSSWGGRAMRWAGVAADLIPVEMRPGIQFQRIALPGTSSRETRTLIRNVPPDVKVGLVRRKLPMNLAEALPFSLLRGETLEIEARHGKGTLHAMTEDGQSLTIEVDGQRASKNPQVDSSTRTIKVQNPFESSIRAAIWLEPKHMERSVPLPQIDEKLLAGLPDFPRLKPASTEYI